MSKVFLIDVGRCNGCHNCQIVCKDEHCDNDWSPIAAPQPETGQFWIQVEETIRGKVPWVRASNRPVLCSHCADAPCMAAAPEGAIYRREDGLVVIDPEKSKGCKDVVAACPTQSIYWNEALQIPQKCTGCAHLLDSGWKAPRCVDACPTDALRFGDYEDFAQELEGAEPRNELAGNGPKVFYLNLPKRFIATTIMDRSVNEVLVGLDVDVKLGDEVVRTVQTDDFGDVFVDQIEPGDYILSFEVNNKTFEVPANCVKEDCVIADFDVSK